MSQTREHGQRLTIVKPAGEAAAERVAADQRTRGTLVLVGVNHTSAPIEVRERLSIPLTRLADAARTLAAQPGVREAMVLSTCNRVEFLTHREDGEDSGAALLRFLHEYFAIPAELVESHLVRVSRAGGGAASVPRGVVAGLDGGGRAADFRTGKRSVRRGARGGRGGRRRSIRCCSGRSRWRSG